MLPDPRICLIAGACYATFKTLDYLSTYPVVPRGEQEGYLHNFRIKWSARRTRWANELGDRGYDNNRVPEMLGAAIENLWISVILIPMLQQPVLPLLALKTIVQMAGLGVAVGGFRAMTSCILAMLKIRQLATFISSDYFNPGPRRRHAL